MIKGEFTTWLWLIALVAMPVVIAKVDGWRQKFSEADNVASLERTRWLNGERMPRELRTSTLFMSEIDLRISEPRPLHGRVDQVFLTEAKELLLIDTKTRSEFRVYDSDVIQLSAYRLMLDRLYGSKYKIPCRAYVRVVVCNNGKEYVQYIPTTLLTEPKVVTLFDRYTLLKLGKVPGRCKCGGALH